MDRERETVSPSEYEKVTWENDPDPLAPEIEDPKDPHYISEEDRSVTDEPDDSDED